MGLIRESSVNINGITDNESIYVVWKDITITRDASSPETSDLILSFVATANIFESYESFLNGELPIATNIEDLELTGQSLSELFDRGYTSFDQMLSEQIEFLNDFVVIND